MVQFYNRNKDSISKVIRFLVAVLLVYVFINYLIKYVVPFVAALIISTILNPLYNLFLKKVKMPKILAALLSLIVFITALVLLGNSIIAKIVDEGKLLVSALPFYQQQIIDSFNLFVDNLQPYMELIPIEMQTGLEDIGYSLLDGIMGFVKSGVQTGSVSAVSGLTRLILVTVVTLISTFFLLYDRALIFGFVTRQMPESWRKTGRVLRTDLFGAMWGYIRAQLTIMSVTSIISIVGLFILRNPFALIAGILIAVVDALPVFGSGFILWPWMLISLISGDYGYTLGLLIIYLSIFITRQVMEPRIIGKNIGLHPLLTLMSMYIGLNVFGMLGFLLGPIIVLSLKSLQDANLLPKWK